VKYMVYTFNNSNCPYCEGVAKRICYGYDGSKRYAIYYCNSCKGQFTVIIKIK
jgi:hypothetical protein